MFVCGRSIFACGREGDGVGDCVCNYATASMYVLSSSLQETKPLQYSPLMLQQFAVLGLVPPSTLKDIPPTLEMLQKKAVSTNRFPLSVHAYACDKCS